MDFHILTVRGQGLHTKQLGHRIDPMTEPPFTPGKTTQITTGLDVNKKPLAYPPEDFKQLTRGLT